MKEIECLVTGKVQGVGYRDFVKKKAGGLWVTGYAENSGVGAVKVVAQGTEQKLNLLLEHLRKGPFMSKVREVSVDWKDPKDKYNDFSIRY